MHQGSVKAAEVLVNALPDRVQGLKTSRPFDRMDADTLRSAMIDRGEHGDLALLDRALPQPRWPVPVAALIAGAVRSVARSPVNPGANWRAPRENYSSQPQGFR